MVFNAVFNSISASAPMHAFLELFQVVLRTIFFPSYWLLFHLTIFETTDSGERGMNPVAMTSILGRILAEPGIEPATFCSQVSNATDRAMGFGSKVNKVTSGKIH